MENSELNRKPHRPLVLGPAFTADGGGNADLAAVPTDTCNTGSELTPSFTPVNDIGSAKLLMAAARQLPIASIGIAVAVEYLHPGVHLDRGQVANDPRACRPTWLALALIVKDTDIRRFVVNVASPTADVVSALKAVLDLPVPFITHDVNDMLVALWTLNLPEPRIIWDTALAEKALHLGFNNPNYIRQSRMRSIDRCHASRESKELKEFEYRLASVCRKHGVNFAFASEDGLGHDGRLAEASLSTQRLCDYVAARATAAAKLYQPQVIAAVEAGLLNHLIQIEMPWVTVVARMQWHGVQVDQAKCEQVQTAIAQNLPGLMAVLNKHGITDAKSQKQLEVFFGREGLLEHFERAGRYEFDNDSLKACEGSHTAIPAIRAARRMLDVDRDKLVSGLFVGADGRVHPHYTVLGTDTGRLTCHAPNILGLGKVLRPLVVPAAGNGIGEADYAQIEVGIAAAVYGDDKLVRLFNTDDVYAAMAKLVFPDGLTVAEKALGGLEFKKKFCALRDRTKVLTLAIIYGLTAHGVALRLDLSVAHAEVLLDRFLGEFPALRESLRTRPSAAADRGFASSVSGLRRYRPVKCRPSHWEINWLANHPVQSSAATVFKAAGIRLDRLYPQYGARLIVPIYDAFVFEAPMEVLAEVAELTRRVMVDAVVEWFPQLRPRVEVNIENPSCWNKDGHADSIDKWVADPTFTL